MQTEPPWSLPCPLYAVTVSLVTVLPSLKRIRFWLFRTNGFADRFPACNMSAGSARASPARSLASGVGGESNGVEIWAAKRLGGAKGRVDWNENLGGGRNGIGIWALERVDGTERHVE